jgi:AraC-like DNA-binding protein
MATRAQLTAIIGEKAVAALIAWRPGRTLRVPKNAAILAPLIGKRAALALSRALPHQTLRIPLFNKRIDRLKALTLLEVGRSPAMIARELGFSRKTVERLRGDHAGEGLCVRENFHRDNVRSYCGPLVLDNPTAPDRIKAQVALPDVTIEVRKYEWDKSQTRLLNVPTFQLSLRLSRRQSKMPTQWRLANERLWRQVRRLSLLPANSGILAKTAAGTMTAVTCIFAPDRFLDLLGIASWPGEKTAAFLELRSPLIEALLARLAREIMLLDGPDQRVLDSLLTLLVSELGHFARQTKRAADPFSKLGPWQLDQLRTALSKERNSGTANLADLARIYSVSPKYLRGQFKRATGDTIHSYVRRLRFERAKARLAADGVRLKDISVELGFKTPSHFAVEFRKHASCSPSEYRARIRAESLAGLPPMNHPGFAGGSDS